MPRRIGLLAIVLLVAGCATPARPASPGPVDDFPPTEQVEALRLPFDVYSPSLAALYTISNAEDRLTARCMKAKGQDWKVIARPTDLQDLRNRRRYGVIEMPIARQFGYHVPTGLLTPADVELKYDARESSLSESQKDAAYGDNGCAREAARQLHPVDESQSALLNQLDRKSLDDSQKEPHVAAAMQSWRDCVRGQGFIYPDPFAAISDPQWWADESAGPTPHELAVAVADVRCKEQTGLVDAWYAAEVSIQEDLIKQNAVYLQKVSAAMKQELNAAISSQR